MKLLLSLLCSLGMSVQADCVALTPDELAAVYASVSYIPDDVGSAPMENISYWLRVDAIMTDAIQQSTLRAMARN